MQEYVPWSTSGRNENAAKGTTVPDKQLDEHKVAEEQVRDLRNEFVDMSPFFAGDGDRKKRPFNRRHMMRNPGTKEG